MPMQSGTKPTGLAALDILFLNLSFLHNSGVLMWLLLIEGV